MPLELDAFLKEGAQPAVDATQAPAEPAAPETPSAESKPSETPAEPAAKAPEAKSDDKQRELDDEHEELLGEHDNGTVPRTALEKVRRDWKSKFAAEQARNAELAKQLEELKRPPLLAQPGPPSAPRQIQLPPLPNPAVDPEAFAQAMFARQQMDRLNDRLNLSQAQTAKQLGPEKLQAYADEFAAAAKTNDNLFRQLYSQPDPYGWLVTEVERMRVAREIGDDPAAYRERLREQIAAEMAAQVQTPQPRAVSPVAGQPPSLAGARSVAGRTTSTFTGPPSMDDILRRPAVRR